MPKTTPTQIRLTEDDHLKLAVIRERNGCASMAEAIRRSIVTEYLSIPEEVRGEIERRQKKRKKKSR